MDLHKVIEQIPLGSDSNYSHQVALLLVFIFHKNHCSAQFIDRILFVFHDLDVAVFYCDPDAHGKPLYLILGVLLKLSYYTCTL